MGNLEKIYVAYNLPSKGYTLVQPKVEEIGPCRSPRSVEQLIRQVSSGTKNWPFVANVESRERVARLSSAVGSPKRHYTDVWEYLRSITSANPFALLLLGHQDGLGKRQIAKEILHHQCLKLHIREVTRCFSLGSMKFFLNFPNLSFYR